MRKAPFLLALVLCLCASLSFAQQQNEDNDVSQGTLEAFGGKGAALGACPLKRTSVKAEISGFLTRVKVVQEFENNFGEAIEAVYTFPLSPAAAVDEMTMRIGERVIRGRIMRREDARKVYQTAKTEGKTASLLDQESPNVFTQSVANIPPGEKITIEISYVETLKYEDGAYEFVFPMTVAPRYKPASATPENAREISPPVIASTRAGHDISIEINLNAGVPVEEIRSKTHEIETYNISPRQAVIKLRNQTAIPNKDFVLRYDVSGRRIEDAVLAHRDARGGFFTLILSPPEKFSVEDVAPKEIVFVLDTSGSMSGFPIEKAKEAMKLALEGLYPDDTFNLITFSGDTHVLFDEPVPATPANLQKAQAFLASREGDGGTEMMEAVKIALAPSDAQNHLRIVCFMTDGQVGNDTEIIGEVKKYRNARVFAFGVGESPNRYLLDNIAQEGRGEVEYVSSSDDGSAAARRFHERIRNPLLTDVSIEWNGLPVTDVYPQKIKDLFSAKPVVVHGRYTRGAKGTIHLRGKVGGQDFAREIAVNLPETEAQNDALATLWARQKIDDLMSAGWNVETETTRVTPQLKTAVTKLGLDYRLLTEFTSFVAVEEKIVNYRGKPRKIRVPVYAPEGDGFGEGNGDAGGIGSNNVTVSGANIGSGTGYGSGNGNGDGVGDGMGAANVPPPLKPAGTPKLPTQSSTSGQFQINGSSGPENSFIVDGQTVTNIRSGALNSNNQIPTGQTNQTPTRTISAGVVNGKARQLPKPAYPAAARAVRATGAVSVQVVIDETGGVISARAVGGHPLLQQAAVAAARQAKFQPTLISGSAVKVTGVIVYNFAMPTGSQPQINAALDKMQLPAEEIKLPEPLSPAAKRQKLIDEKFHLWLADLAARLDRNVSQPAANEAKFIRGGKAQIQLWLTEKTPATIEKLKQLGFEIVSEKDEKIVTGRISLEKLVALTEIEQVRYVLPSLK
ncbi:MAG TPA: TonB family protein [Pyrinomonadaceae bacterium]|nr:TonB family protein [Pyrinomonadaceae bacterium]